MIHLRRYGTLLGFRASCRLDVGAYTRPIGARLGELVVETLPGPYRWTDFEVFQRAARPRN